MAVWCYKEALSIFAAIAPILVFLAFQFLKVLPVQLHLGSVICVQGAVGVFETGIENSSELVRSFDVAFPPREEIASRR